MKKTYSFPRYVTLNTKTVLWALPARVMWLFALLFIPIWRFLGAPLAGDESFAVILSLTLTSSALVGFCLCNLALYRLFNYYKQKLKHKFLAYILYLICPIPLLELKWLCSDRSDREVNAFLQANPEGRISLMHSLFFMFFDNNTEIDLNKLAELIRNKSSYFATTRDDEDILIATNRGLVVCSISENAKLYMFIEVDPTKQPFSLSSDCGWEVEYSQNMSAGAFVYEKEVDPLSDIESLSDTIITAIDNLLNKKLGEQRKNEQ